MCVCNTLYEIYPKTARTEIIFETDGTAAVFRELPVDIVGDVEGNSEVQDKILYDQDSQPQPLEM